MHINLTNEINPQLLSYPTNSITFTGLVTLVYSPEKEGTYYLKHRGFVEDKDPNNSILK
jgi:hypothetical protein